jgi:hypothetical protein
MPGIVGELDASRRLTRAATGDTASHLILNRMIRNVAGSLSSSSTSNRPKARWIHPSTLVGRCVVAGSAKMIWLVLIPGRFIHPGSNRSMRLCAKPQRRAFALTVSELGGTTKVW